MICYDKKTYLVLSVNLTLDLQGGSLHPGFSISKTAVRRQRGDEHLPGAGGGRLDCDAILWNRRKRKTGIKLLTLQLCVMLRDTGTGPAGYIRWVLLTLLIYLNAQREAGSDTVLCCPRAAWQGMDTSVGNTSLLFLACFQPSP